MFRWANLVIALFREALFSLAKPAFVLQASWKAQEEVFLVC